jgi:uncharacterized protein YggE
MKAMNARAIVIVGLICLGGVLPLLAQDANGLNAGEESSVDGIRTGSFQTVSTKPTKVRLYATLRAGAEDAAVAFRKLQEKRKSAIQLLKSLGASENAIEIARPSLLRSGRNDSGPITSPKVLSLRTSEEEWLGVYVAHAAVKADWDAGKRDSDELELMAIDLMEQVRKSDVFGVVPPAKRTPTNQDDWTYSVDAMACPVYVVFVGEISAEAGAAASKRAFDEAHAEAVELAAIAKRQLGKLKKMSRTIQGRREPPFYQAYSNYDVVEWSMQNSAEYEKSDFPNPMRIFSSAEKEVFAENPAKLKRVYLIQLRFDLE